MADDDRLQTSTVMVAMATRFRSIRVFTTSPTAQSNMVRTIKLSDGKEIPALGWGMGTGGIKEHARTVKFGLQAVEAGIVHLDTAQVRNDP